MTDSTPGPATLNLAEIMARLQDKKLPPVDKWNPDFCGDIDMRIARDGTWYYMGSPIGRKRMVKLFSTVIRRDEDSYFLVTPVEKLGIIVDDAPFVAVEADIFEPGPEQSIVFRTNVDDEVIAGPDNPIRVEIDPETAEPSPYVLVRKNLWALIARPVFYQLVDAGEERIVDGKTQLGIVSRGRFFAIGSLDAAD
ncbi:DUF1285 domain-containing protein [Emcibacter sp. SYSU 3D8]|uniref:DUF1285 domain-containing protein n=1 Tax=Emcibacter sp. SYSU 3D8 TaxID=3133969 RepID=UPI0031FEAEAA